MAKPTDPLEPVEHVVTPNDWRRPHPLALVVEVVTAIPSLVAGLLFVNSSLGATNPVADLAEMVVVLASLGSAIARWLTTRYALTDESLLYQRGMIWRRKQVLPRANVQNVSTKAGLLARLANIVELQVSDASRSGDISIRFVSASEADRLATLLRRQTRPLIATQVNPDSHDALRNLAAPLAEPVQDPSSSPPISAPTIGEITRSALTTTPVLALATLAVFMIAAFAVTTITTDLPLPNELLGPAVLGYLGLNAIFGLALLPHRVLTLGGFQLAADPDRLWIRFGLLTEVRVATRRERIQQVTIHRDLAHRLQGIERVTFQTADTELLGGFGATYLSPTGQTGGWRALAAESIGELQVTEDQLNPVDNKTIRRVSTRFVVAAVPLIALIAIHPLWLLCPIATALGGHLYSRRRHQTLGWALSNDQLLTRSGVIDLRLRLVLLDKVQITRVSQTWFQRRLGLATIWVSTAGHTRGQVATIPDLTKADAHTIADSISRRSAQSPIGDTI